jgi:hypothetical protein
MNTWRAIRFTAAATDDSDRTGQPVLPLATWAERAITGRRVATGRFAQSLAHRPDRITAPVGLDEPILHANSHAKSMAAFFNLSFASLSLAFSPRNLPRSSSLTGRRLPAPVCSSTSNSSRHFRNRFPRMPNARPICAVGRSPSAPNLNASSLNSRLYLFYSFRAMTHSFQS